MIQRSFFSIALFMILSTSYSRNMTEKEIIYGFETGQYSIEELKKMVDNKHIDLIIFLEFVLEYNYGYNINRTAVYNEYITKIDSNSQWNLTAQLIHHTFCNIDDKIHEKILEIKKKDTNSINFYFIISVFYSELDPFCDSTNVCNILLKDESPYKNYSTSNFMKANILSLVGDYNNSLKYARLINFKNREDITYLNTYIAYLNLNDSENFPKILRKLLNCNNGQNYSLELLPYFIFQISDLEKAHEVSNSYEFDNNALYMNLMGHLAYEEENYGTALVYFKNAYFQSKENEYLFDLISISVASREFTIIQSFLDNNTVNKEIWFKAFSIVYIMEYEYNAEKAKNIYNNMNECQQRIAIEYIEPYVRVKNILVGTTKEDDK